MSTKTAAPKLNIRYQDDPRRHVPLITRNGGLWLMTVRDAANEFHAKATGDWSEALGYAATWAHINAVHGLAQDASHELAA